MNLAEALGLKVWSPSSTPADSAEPAETQQTRALPGPQRPAESCGPDPQPGKVRKIPQQAADAPAQQPRGLQAKSANPQNPQHIVGESSEVPACTAEWLRAQGCAVLPADVAFIHRHLPRATHRRRAILCGYVACWLAAMERELLPHRKENRGRFTANTRLREGRLKEPTDADG